MKRTIASVLLAALATIGQAQQAPALPGSNQQVLVGRVLDVQTTTTEKAASTEKRVAGGVIGGAAGALAAKDQGWQGQTLAGALGAFLGDMAASAALKEKKSFQQIIVKIDKGATVAVNQEATDQIAVGDMVYVVGAEPNMRIVKAK